SGPGIRQEDRKRLFEPFVQLTRDASQQGTGLGLSITRQFVQMMNGRISVDSEPGRGSCFRVELPVKPAQEVDILSADPGHAGEILGLASGQPAYRILIAEDQHDNRMLLSLLMANVGLETRLAENGRQCVDLFRSWRPHLIWMDRRMPVMDGLEATREIRRLPGGDKVKIVAVTASSFKEQQQEIIDAGLDDFLRKPYRFNEIYDCMARHLGLTYCYTDGAEAPAAPVALAPEALVALPQPLRTELRESLESLERERIESTIGRIAARDATLARNLSRLAHEFNYPAILEALDAPEDRD
ncbi:MAG: response regulator, partial [Candidatus Thiodiazotropha sp.]